jgi:hypothetical protein
LTVTTTAITKRTTPHIGPAINAALSWVQGFFLQVGDGQVSVAQGPVILEKQVLQSVLISK